MLTFMSTILSSLRKPTESVISRLERAIVMGEFRPRERLLEVSLSQQLGTTRNRIRSAFRVLAEKGLIFLAPGRGATVAEYTPKQVQDMYHVRQVLETAALDLAVAHITREAIETLRELARRFSSSVQQGGFLELTEYNDAFHRYLLHMGGNESLSQMIDQLWLRCHLVRHFAWLNREHLKTSAAQHEEIVDLLEGGDIARLKELYARHTIGGRDVYLQQVELALGGTAKQLISGHHTEHDTRKLAAPTSDGQSLSVKKPRRAQRAQS